MPFWHGNSRSSNLKGFPNSRPSKGRRLSMFMTEADYKRNRKQQRDRLPYSGSEEQMQHRHLFWR
jgi:hypothetical protein